MCDVAVQPDQALDTLDPVDGAAFQRLTGVSDARLADLLPLPVETASLHKIGLTIAHNNAKCIGL